jgi:hypothetical protein
VSAVVVGTVNFQYPALSEAEMLTSDVTYLGFLYYIILQEV